MAGHKTHAVRKATWCQRCLRHRKCKFNIIIPNIRTPCDCCRIVDKKLETRTVLPGLKVQYSTDDGITWNDVTTNVEVDGKIKLRTRLVWITPIAFVCRECNGKQSLWNVGFNTYPWPIMLRLISDLRNTKLLARSIAIHPWMGVEAQRFT